MIEFRADLHCHTACSDGTMDPEEIVFHAKKLGLSGLSITDHDSILAYKEAIPAAKKAGILLGSGVEFSSMDHGVSVHILGYDIDLDNPDLLALCKRHIERRHDRNERIIQKLKAQGMPIDSEPFDEKAAQGLPAGRPHIAKALMEKGYVDSIQSAFNQLIGDGKPCFDPGISISSDETIEVIHAAKGKAFLAHPHVIRDRGRMPLLLEKPFDGIECYYSKCFPEKERKWLKLAEKKNLLISGGSDFHGSIRPGIELGCSWVNRETFDKIFQKLL